MSVIALPDKLIEWARRAGFATTTENDSTVFWSDPGGEIRLRVGKSGAEFCVWRADRAANEALVLSAPMFETVETYLWRFFGTSIRSKARLTRLRVPTEADDVAAGYTIDIDDDGGVQLSNSQRNLVAKAFGGSAGVMTLVPLSYLLGERVDDIKGSFESPTGEPLLSQRRLASEG
jgi:hypothetical protein